MPCLFEWAYPSVSWSANRFKYETVFADDIDAFPSCRKKPQSNLLHLQKATFEEIGRSVRVHTLDAWYCVSVDDVMKCRGGQSVLNKSRQTTSLAPTLTTLV